LARCDSSGAIHAKQEFAMLEQQKSEIEKALGFGLAQPGNEGDLQIVHMPNTDFLDEQHWPQQF
jgi:hypothetical protein